MQPGFKLSNLCLSSLFLEGPSCPLLYKSGRGPKSPLGPPASTPFLGVGDSGMKGTNSSVAPGLLIPLLLLVKTARPWPLGAPITLMGSAGPKNQAFPCNFLSKPFSQSRVRKSHTRGRRLGPYLQTTTEATSPYSSPDP